MMKTNEETLSQVMSQLSDRGFKEQFELTENGVRALSSKKDYKPNELKIVKEYRFDGMTNPGDESMLLALETSKGSKGTLVVSGDVHSEQNQSLLNQIPSE